MNKQSDSDHTPIRKEDLEAIATFAPILQGAWDSYVRLTDTVLVAAAATLLVFVTQIKPSEWNSLPHKEYIEWVLIAGATSALCSFVWRVTSQYFAERELLGIQRLSDKYRKMLDEGQIVTGAMLTGQKNTVIWFVHVAAQYAACPALLLSWVFLYRTLIP